MSAKGRALEYKSGVSHTTHNVHTTRNPQRHQHSQHIHTDLHELLSLSEVLARDARGRNGEKAEVGLARDRLRQHRLARACACASVIISAVRSGK